MYPLGIQIVPGERLNGPPYPLHEKDYHELLDESWELIYVQDVDVEKGKGRTTGAPGDERKSGFGGGSRRFNLSAIVTDGDWIQCDAASESRSMTSQKRGVVLSQS